ncbi:MAG: type III pantothenate kinase [Thermodesulfovibrionales bacterium]
MLIGIDIGNSSINIGFFTGKGLFVRKIETHPMKSCEKYRSLLKSYLDEISIENNTHEVIISSVVDTHTKTIAEACKALIPERLLIVGPEIKTGLIFDIPDPERLGSDRIANSVASFTLYKRPVAAVDFGTATTISVVGKDAHYIGGAILPGIGLMNEALAGGTSKLTEVILNPPQSALGIDTESCIRSGIFYGTAGAIERIIKEIEKEVKLRLKIVITGGFSYIISKFLRRKHELRPNLTLEGLKIIYMRNRNV